jgi:hypothetical protein
LNAAIPYELIMGAECNRFDIDFQIDGRIDIDSDV